MAAAFSASFAVEGGKAGRVDSDVAMSVVLTATPLETGSAVVTAGMETVGTCLLKALTPARLGVLLGGGGCAGVAGGCA